MNVYTRVSKAESYRRYADELRAIADGLRSALRSAETRRTLLQVADDFEQMAQAAESIMRSTSVVKGEARSHPMSDAVGPRSD